MYSQLMRSRSDNAVNLLNEFTRKLWTGVQKRAISDSARNSLGIIGVPFSKGQRKIGVEKGPDILRRNGLFDELKNISSKLKVIDYGDLKYNLDHYGDIKNLRNFNDFISCNRKLAEKVQNLLEKNDKFLVLGGDHAIGCGSVAGHLIHDPNLALIWVDAHADINFHKTSGSGNMHGMPVSFLIEELKTFWNDVPGLEWITKRIPAKRVGYLGLRDVDNYEKLILEKFGISAYGLDTIDRYGVDSVVEKLLDSIDPNRNLNYHVSFDIDALDPLDAPSTGTHAPGGLLLREGIYIMEKLYETGRVKGMDLVEFNPEIGTPKDVRQTAQSAIQIIKAGYGAQRLSRNNYDDNLEDFLK